MFGCGFGWFYAWLVLFAACLLLGLDSSFNSVVGVVFLLLVIYLRYKVVVICLVVSIALFCCLFVVLVLWVMVGCVVLLWAVVLGDSWFIVIYVNSVAYFIGLIYLFFCFRCCFLCSVLWCCVFGLNLVVLCGCLLWWFCLRLRLLFIAYCCNFDSCLFYYFVSAWFVVYLVCCIWQVVILCLMI